MRAGNRGTAWVGAALLALVGTLGCAGDAPDGGDPANPVRSALVEDAHLPSLDGGVAVPVPAATRVELERRIDRLELRAPLRCEQRMDPLLCNGHCPPGQGCCITGVRPRGICQPYAACDEQCLLDCLSLLYRGGSLRDVEQCESMCTWVAPTADCVPTL